MSNMEYDINLTNSVAKAQVEAKLPCYNGKIIRKMSNNAYDVLLDGGKHALRNVTTRDGRVFNVNDTVTVIRPLTTNQAWEIVGLSNYVVPEETVYEFEW